MADINHIITLGIGTPADIEHFILVGLNANPAAGNLFVNLASSGGLAGAGGLAGKGGGLAR